jgi:uncharacterized low-complexity protein
MKRTALLGALLVAVLACTVALSTPKAVHAIMCCEGYYGTSQYWEMKATCAEAQTAFRNAALPEAQANCGGSGACGISIPNCYQSGNMWVVDGFMYHGCMEQCGPPLP